MEPVVEQLCGVLGQGVVGLLAYVKGLALAQHAFSGNIPIQRLRHDVNHVVLNVIVYVRVYQLSRTCRGLVVRDELRLAIPTLCGKLVRAYASKVLLVVSFETYCGFSIYQTNHFFPEPKYCSKPMDLLNLYHQDQLGLILAEVFQLDNTDLDNRSHLFQYYG